MKKKVKNLSVFLVFLLVFTALFPEAEANKAVSAVVTAEAAELPEARAEYVLVKDGDVGKYYKHRSVISISENTTFQLQYVDGEGNLLPVTVASGSSLTIEWNVVDNNNVSSNSVISAKGNSVNKDKIENLCELSVKGIGYSNLTARVTETDGVTGNVSKYDYIWTFTVELASDPNNLTQDNSGNRDYGLMQALSTDIGQNTLQLLGPEVVGDPALEKYNKYLILLKKADLFYKVTDNFGEEITLDNYSTENDIEMSAALSNMLKDIVVWSSSDETVAKVEYGVVTGVGAGRCVITATTQSRDGMSTQSISFNVVVKPTAYLDDPAVSNPVSVSNFSATVNNNSFKITANTRNATNLVWTVYNKDETGDVLWSSNSNRTTDKFQADVYDTSGDISFRKVKAGTYFITARVSSDYAENNTKVDRFTCTITVPVFIPSGPVYMNVNDTYSIVDNSTVPVAKWYQYTSDDGTIASVSTQGIITGVSEGTTKIRLVRIPGSGYDEFFDGTNIDQTVPTTAEIEVRVIDSISLNYSSAVIYTDGTLNLKAETSNPTLVEWTSSNDTIASVDENGLVTGLRAGSAVITAAQTVNGVKKTATCKIMVRQSVTSIVLTPDKKDIAVGDNLTINATISPSLNGVSLRWVSSNDTIVKVVATNDLSATVSGVSGGTAVVSAINQENVIVGSCLIQVFEPIAGITLSQTNVIIPLATGWFQLYATITPATAENQEVIWKSTDPTIASVNERGAVTLLRAGKTSIMAISRTNSTISATCNLEITMSVSGIKLDTTTRDMYVGETYRITYVLSPVGASNAAVTWTSSNMSVASVDPNGMISARGVGTTVIIGKTVDGGYTATCTINVGRVATAVKLDVTSLVLNAGDVYYLESTLTPADTTEKTIVYETSDKNVVTVSKKGKVTAKKAGTTIVLAKTKSGSMAYCAVKVVQGVTGIVISDKEYEIDKGDSFELSAEVVPDEATDQTIIWRSSNEAIAKVDEDGEVDAVAGGVAVITCETAEGGFTDQCIVTVNESVTDVKLDYNYYKLGLNETYRLNAEISGETATNKDVTWFSSDDSVVSVDNNGRIRGLELGEATITCEASDGSGAVDTCEVRVCRLVSNIELDVSYLTLIQGHSHTLNARVYPEDATFNEAMWTSENTAVAIVDQNGVVTALTPGSTIIHAEASDSSGVSSLCYVSVIAPVATSNISISESEVVLSPGETKTVAFSLVPNNTTEKVSWTSDNNIVATVDSETGLITAGEIGTANITIMSESGRKGTVKVFVVGLSRSYVELQQYTSLLLRLEVDGNGSNKYTIRWDVDNQEIATVQNGKVTAKATGTTTVYAVVNGRRLACVVKVVKIK